jgi:centrosomal protein CEP72
LKELEKLHYNSSLVELDLRLNPITKEENDYRLFLIHILPSLKILDDRSIRESERAMAATYFEPNLISNGNEKHNGYESYQNGVGNSAVSSRVKSVTNIAKRSNGIDSDDGCDNANFHNYLNLRLHENGNGNGNVNGEDYYVRKQQLEEYSPRSML